MIWGSRPEAKMVPKTGPRVTYQSFFSVRKSISCVFFARTRSGSLPDRFRRLRGLSRARFRLDFSQFFGTVLRDLAGVSSGVFLGRQVDAERSSTLAVLRRFDLTRYHFLHCRRRSLPGCAAVLPGYTADLRYSLSGVPLGYGDLAKRFK